MTGKTFWALDASSRVVRGVTVLDRKSKPCGVVYIASESAAGVRTRMKGLRTEIGPLGGGFRLIGDAPNLTDVDDVLALTTTLQQLKDSMSGTDTPLGMVVLDTLSASIPGADENTAKDMSPVLTSLQAMATRLELLVLVIAHTGKDITQGLRGWSGLFANADGVIMLAEPVEMGPRTGVIQKVKDAQSGDAFAFELIPITVGYNEDGDEISTCIIGELEAPESTKKLPSQRLSPKQQLVLRAIRAEFESGTTEPVPVSPTVPPGTKGIQRDAAKRRAMEMGYREDDQKPESARRKLNVHLNDLLGKGFIRCEGELLWPIR